MEYRLLTPEEVLTLAPVFASYGVDTPSPELSAVAGAIEGGVIVGFHVLQLVPHAEPIWISPEHRGKVDWRKLNEQLEAPFAAVQAGEFYTFSDSPRVAAMLKKVGYEEMPYKVWRKKFSSGDGE